MLDQTKSASDRRFGYKWTPLTVKSSKCHETYHSRPFIIENGLRGQGKVYTMEIESESGTTCDRINTFDNIICRRQAKHVSVCTLAKPPK